MSWLPDVGVDTAIALTVGYKESVVLRLSRDSGPYLAIGDGVEITLARSHVAALHEQSAAVLGDMIALDAAENQVVTAHAVGDQASTTAEYARKQADAAMAVGATQQARDTRAAADKAADAAILVQTAVCAALDALQTAEESMDAAGRRRRHQRWRSRRRPRTTCPRPRHTLITSPFLDDYLTCVPGEDRRAGLPRPAWRTSHGGHAVPAVAGGRGRARWGLDLGAPPAGGHADGARAAAPRAPVPPRCAAATRHRPGR